MTLSRAVLALAAVLFVGACAEMQTRQSTSDATLVTATGTVMAVDQTSRQVTLSDNSDGSQFTVAAGPEVRNLAQVKPGDTVQIDYYQSTTLSMASPDDTGEPAAAVVAGRAPEGDKPGAGAVVTSSFVVTVVSYDSDSGLAVVRTPDGLIRRTVVSPELRSFAARQQAGARVLVTLTEAVAVSVTPQAK
jgi:Cu/Ag efflux protein CusF